MYDERDDVEFHSWGYIDRRAGEVVRVRTSDNLPPSPEQKKYIRDIRRKNPYAPPFTGNTMTDAREYISKYKGGMYE
jgi:hypothetical protein